MNSAPLDRHAVAFDARRVRTALVHSTRYLGRNPWPLAVVSVSADRLCNWFRAYRRIPPTSGRVDCGGKPK